MNILIKSLQEKNKKLGLLFILILSVSLVSNAQEKPVITAERDSIITAAREIISMQKYCGLITVDSSGNPQARTMNPFPPEEDMTIWMATNSRSQKVQEIKNNSQVCLYYANHNQATGYVSITGKAVLVNDMDEKLKRKREYWSQAFPDWKYLILIKVIPEQLEVINYKRGMVGETITWSAPSIEFK
jgi:general stress protein 26